jgi:hypothetical protein
MIVLIVAAGVTLSLITRDPHWLNRAGALIAGCAAAAILLQIKAEMTLEHEREDLQHQAINARETEVTAPLDALELRLTLKRLQALRMQVENRRLVVASYVISGAMLGEVLHGFGDLVMCHVLSVCTPH